MVSKGYLLDSSPVNEDKYGNRWYYVEELGEWAPSVTTVLSKGFPKGFGLINWFKNSTVEEIEAKSNEGKTLGTRAHKAVENYLNGIENTEEDRELMRGFLQWEEDSNVPILEQEKAVWLKDGDMLVAGRFDLRSEDTIIDIKRSKGIYESYPPQIALYAKATGMPLGAILRLCDTRKGYQFKKYTEEEIDESYEAFKAAYVLFKYLGGLKGKP